MEVNALREIRVVGAVSGLKAENEVQPPFAFDPVARLEDDAYDGNDHAPERGLEEEEPEAAAELDEADSDGEGAVDCFA